MNSIEETSEQFNIFKPVKNGIRSIMSTMQSISMICNSIYHRHNDVDTTSSEITPKYNFTGQHTDIAFCDVDGSINQDTINGISDPVLRGNITDSFNQGVMDGYLNLDAQGNYYLTDKGKEHINSKTFIEQFEKDQKDFLVNTKLENSVQIKLYGNQNDLNVFRYVDSINLNKLMYDNPAQFKQVVSYFDKCEKYDFVNIDRDGIVTPTEKCKTFLSNNEKFDFQIEKVTNKNVDSIANQYSSKVININDYYKGAQVAEKGAKAGTEATKVGANAAKAGASAASGAATAGVSTAATAVVELSKAGKKALDKAMDLQQKQNRRIAAMQNRI